MGKGWDRVIMGCERGQSPPCGACPCGTPAGEVPRGTTVALLLHSITLSLSPLSQFFHPPAAIGNCSGYLAAKWHFKNKQMHPKQHLAPATWAGTGCSWQGAGREVAAPSPRATSLASQQIC